MKKNSFLRFSLLRFAIATVAVSLAFGFGGAILLDIPAREGINLLRSMGVSVCVSRNAIGLKGEIGATPSWLGGAVYCVECVDVPLSDHSPISVYLARLQRIDWLVLRNSDATQVLSGIQNCAWVRIIDIGNTQMTPNDTALLSNVRGVEELYFFNPPYALEDMNADQLLAYMDKNFIQVIDIECCISDSGIAMLASAGRLTHLSLKGDLSSVSENGWRTLGTMHHLESLSLVDRNGVNISIEYFGRLLNLKSLKLGDNMRQFKDDLLELESRLPQCKIAFQSKENDSELCGG